MKFILVKISYFITVNLCIFIEIISLLNLYLNKIIAIDKKLIV